MARCHVNVNATPAQRPRTYADSRTHARAHNRVNAHAPRPRPCPRVAHAHAIAVAIARLISGSCNAKQGACFDDHFSS
eukprot:3293662-Pleurochrysis_carterae.AAC.2